MPESQSLLARGDVGDDKRRRELAPGTHEAFDQVSRAVFSDGAPPDGAEQLIAVAVAGVTQPPSRAGEKVIELELDLRRS
jgi:hypothetical protein